MSSLPSPTWEKERCPQSTPSEKEIPHNAPESRSAESPRYSKAALVAWYPPWILRHAKEAKKFGGVSKLLALKPPRVNPEEAPSHTPAGT